MSTPELKPCKTPITDAEAYSVDSGPHINVVSANFARKLESALNAAREAIEKAPHDGPCLAGNNWFKKPGFESPCTCWKAAALAQISPQQSKTT